LCKSFHEVCSNSPASFRSSPAGELAAGELAAGEFAAGERAISGQGELAAGELDAYLSGRRWVVTVQ